MQQRGHAARRGQAADRPVPASTRSPRLGLGAVTNLRDDTSALTVEGDTCPAHLAISLHEALRSSILWTVSRSCLVSLPLVLGTALRRPSRSFRTWRPPISRGRLVRPSGYRIPIFIRTCKDKYGKCSDEVDIQGHNGTQCFR